MFSILVCALLVVYPVIAITLPNGFTFDEKLYFKIEPRLTYAQERCETKYSGCSNDCTAHLGCSNGDYIVDPLNSYQCDSYYPYCVKNSGRYVMCSGNFPLSNQACLTIATNNFICTENGYFPDPTDCTKYHVCNGSTHSIVECPASHYYTSDLNIKDPYTNPGNGEFKCRFIGGNKSCSCEGIICTPNAYSFRHTDYFHYAYCLEIGTQRKTLMFKCPPGTRHYGTTNAAGSVDCVPM